MRIYVYVLTVLEAAGDRRALTLLERAYSELVDQASRLNEARRKLFFERVPWNRAIVAAWEKRGGL
jgi:hypothetical protein